MRLLHLADLHLGVVQFPKQAAYGLGQRALDVEKTFGRVIDRAIELAPDLVVIGGDVFHSATPSPRTVVHAFEQFTRLTRALPTTPVVMVAGNHDLPRQRGLGCILSLLTSCGVHVATTEAKRLTFGDVAIFCVPDAYGLRATVALEPDPRAKQNVLLLHGEVEGMMARRMPDEITQERLGAHRWDYVALGHYHVMREVAPNACYPGSIDYTSSDIWGERREERQFGIPGKGMLEVDLATGARVFHPIAPSREIVELEPFSAREMSPAELDLAIGERVAWIEGGIAGKIVRLVVHDVPRHVTAELDQEQLRAWKAEAMHFQLDERRPKVVKLGSASVRAKGKTLNELVRERFAARVMASDIDPAALTNLAIKYLDDASRADEARALDPVAAAREDAA
jgi:exonuclease SbcD